MPLTPFIVESNKPPTAFTLDTDESATTLAAYFTACADEPANPLATPQDPLRITVAPSLTMSPIIAIAESVAFLLTNPLGGDDQASQYCLAIDPTRSVKNAFAAPLVTLFMRIDVWGGVGLLFELVAGTGT